MTLRAWLEEKPFTLALSAGFFGFFAHAGFTKAILEAGLRPVAYTGSSAGALVSGMLAAGLEPLEIEKILITIKKADFWDPGLGLGLLKGHKFERVIRGHLPHKFAELKTPLRISTFDVARLRTHVFTHGPVAVTLRASCALPLLFHPVRIGARYFVDGGVRDKLGFGSVKPEERTFSHYLLGGGRSSRAEVNRDRTKLSPHHRLFQIEGLPRLGPDRLHLGPDAYEHAYRATKRALDSR